tara:strand:- start:125 stop:358 length:234 start_codon:yes stop_codon:yes gene_type:complete
MSNSIFLIAMAISVAYLIFKFIEMRFILKENKPIKVLARDTLIVYLSVLLGNFVIQQITTVNLSSKVTQVFTNDPGF